MPTAELQIQQEFSKLPSNFVALVMVSPTTYPKVSLELSKFLMKKIGLAGIYITVNKPYKTLVETFKENNFDLDKIFFIDMITRTAGGSLERLDKCLFIASPSNLTDVGIAIKEALDSIKEQKKFLVLDALSTLLTYNKPEILIKFVHYLISNIRLQNVYGVLLAFEKNMDEKLTSATQQLCDKTLELSGE